MRDYRHAQGLHVLEVVFAQPAVRPAARVIDVVLVLGQLRVGRPAGDEAARVALLPEVHPAGQELIAALPARLIAVRQQQERRVVAILAHDALAFRIEPVAQGLVLAGIRPDRALDLKVESEFVGGSERRFRRAPGVEANEIQPMCLTRTDHLLPSRHVGRWIAGQREDAAFQCAPEERRMAVQHKLLALDSDLAQAELHRPLIIGLGRL